MEDLVSIIMPTYNAKIFLKDSIEGIIGQTYSNWELLITDDCSTDESVLAILREYAQKDSRIRLFFLEENKGCGVARNNSIRAARGRYIAFCDSDDIWVPNKLEKQIAFLREKQICLTFSSYYLLDAENKIFGEVKAPKSLTLGQLKRDNKIGCSTAIYDTRFFGKFYMPPMRKRQDWAMFLNLLKKCGSCQSLSESLVYYRVRQGSVSRKKLTLVKYNIEVYRVVFGYSYFVSILYFLFLFLPTYGLKKIRQMVSLPYQK